MLTRQVGARCGIVRIVAGGEGAEREPVSLSFLRWIMALFFQNCALRLENGFSTRFHHIHPLLLNLNLEALRKGHDCYLPVPRW